MLMAPFRRRLCPIPFIFSSEMSSEDEFECASQNSVAESEGLAGPVVDEGEREGNVPQPPQPPKPKRQKTETRSRGTKITVASRMKEYPGKFFQQGNEMWCIACQKKVDHTQVPFAQRHLESKRHEKAQEKHDKLVEVPGPSAPMLSQSQGSSQAAEQLPGTGHTIFLFLSPPNTGPSPPKQKQAKIDRMMGKENTNQAVGDDFVAAFLQAGIPLAKLTHPSLSGLFRKYTKVSGPFSSNASAILDPNLFRRMHPLLLQFVPICHSSV